MVGHGAHLYARYGGKEVCHFATVPTPLRKDQWTHLTFTWDKGVRSLYVDSKLAVKCTILHTALFFHARLRIDSLTCNI